MQDFLDKLSAASVSSLAKCGEIFWAPQGKDFTYCCWHCAELFVEMPAFMRHVWLEHGNSYCWSDCGYGAHEQNNVSAEREKLVLSYTVEELLAVGNEEEFVKEECRNTPNNATETGKKPGDFAGEKSNLQQLPSTYICEMKDEELVVNISNEYVDTDDDVAENIDYSVEELQMLLEAEQLMCQFEQEDAKNNDGSANFSVGEVTMDSGVGLQETHDASADGQSDTLRCQTYNKSAMQALNLVVKPLQTQNRVNKPKETAIVSSIDKTPNIAELVEAFYKDFNPKPQNLPINIASNKPKQTETSPTNNAFKVWDLFDQHNPQYEQENHYQIECNRKITAQNSTHLTMDNTLLVAQNSATIEHQMPKQSTPKETSKTSARNLTPSTINSLRKELNVTCPSLLKSYSNVLDSYPGLTNLQFSTLLKNPYTNNTVLQSRATRNTNHTAVEKMACKRQMLQHMQNIKKRILQADTGKENTLNNEVKSADKSLPSTSDLDKEKIPLNMPNARKVESVIVQKIQVLDAPIISKSLKAVEATGKSLTNEFKSLRKNTTPDIANNVDVSIEFLQNSRTHVVNLSAFDCILNDNMPNANVNDPLEISTSDICYKPDDTLMQLKNIQMYETLIKHDGFQHNLNNSVESMELDTSLPLSDTTTDLSQLNLTNSTDPDTSIVKSIDDLKLLEIVGLQAIQVNSLETELPLSRIEFMHLKALQFANIYRKSPYIWLHKCKEVKAHEQLDVAFENFTAQINTMFRSQLTKGHAKRLINLITIWYTTQQDTKFMYMKPSPESMDFYLLLFAFLPKTSRHIYYCEFCPDFFRAQLHYMRHRAIHTGHLSYTCQHCGREFLRPKSMQIHEPKCKKNRGSRVEHSCSEEYALQNTGAHM